MTPPSPQPDPRPDPRPDRPTPQELLDRLLEHRGLQLSAPPEHAPQDSPQDLARLQHLKQLGDLIQRDPAAAPSDDLTQRTLARVREARQQRRFAAQVAALAAGPDPATYGGTWRLSQLGAIAAALIVGASLLLPVLTRTRTQALRIQSAANLAMAGQGFAGYAADFNQALPRMAVQPGSEWWRIGDPIPASPNGQPAFARSNSAHLFILVRGQYVRPDDLTCPTNFDANRGLDLNALDWPDPRSVSFSYQNQFTPQVIRLDRAADLALLANRNPLFEVRVARQPDGSTRKVFHFNGKLDPNAASPAFHGRGQNVLTADGSVTWTRVPLSRTGDNLWQVRGQTGAYHGTETPSDEADAFLVP